MEKITVKVRKSMNDQGFTPYLVVKGKKVPFRPYMRADYSYYSDYELLRDMGSITEGELKRLRPFFDDSGNFKKEFIEFLRTPEAHAWVAEWYKQFDK